MGCVNACICSGNCLRCGSYKKEEYVGQAEDLYDYLHGYDAEKEAYEKAMEEAYEEERTRQEYEMQMMFEGGEK